MTVSRSVLVKMRNVSDKICRKNQNKHFMFNNLFSRKSCRLWDNVEKYCRDGQATDDNLAHALYTLDNYATDTLLECVIVIALLLLEWLQELHLSLTCICTLPLLFLPRIGSHTSTSKFSIQWIKSAFSSRSRKSFTVCVSQFLNIFFQLIKTQFTSKRLSLNQNLYCCVHVTTTVQLHS